MVLSKSYKKGGSLASDDINKLGPQQLCNAKFTTTNKEYINFQDIVNNYAKEYNTTGGGINFEYDVKKFISSILDNRVFDLYVKYMGITLLSPATLVPIGLLMGQRTFTKILNDIKRNDQKGGGVLDVKIPVIDDEIVGTGLKLAGLTALSLSPYTLVPLGVLMIVYDKFLKEQYFAKGGSQKSTTNCGITPYNPDNGIPFNNLDNDILKSKVFSYHGVEKNCNDINRPFIEGGHKNKKGGSKLPVPNTIPISVVHLGKKIYSGQDVTPFTHGTDYINHELQLSSYNPYKSENMRGIDGAEVEVPPVGHHDPQSRPLPMSMAGGASSDWGHTLYSGGPNNSYKMSDSQLRSFNKNQNDYTNNPNLVNRDYHYNPLYDSNQGYTNSSVSTSNFN